MINITMIMITFVNSTISKSTSPATGQRCLQSNRKTGSSKTIFWRWRRPRFFGA